MIKLTKTYKELNKEEQLQTYNNYQSFCKTDSSPEPFENFEAYDYEQKILNMDFDVKTLECLG